jgi:hypothetical protein
MTLSHRRSHKESTQLLTRNSRIYHRRIPESSLPRTYLDAVKIARELGVSYLWIDSLCIMQDSTKDWHRETAKLSDIYAGAYCNIAATGCTDDTDTLHPWRNPEEVRGCIIKNNPDSTFSVKAHDEGYKTWNTSIKESPLLERGWVFQELNSAPRTLFFAKDQLWWQCKTQKASESLPNELDITSRRYQSTSQPLDMDTIPPQFYGPSGWADIVQDYSKCHFTFPEKDRLVALSGLARKHGNEQNYLAGLWKQDIIFELTWRVCPTTKGAKATKEYQAPSWSWASLNQEVIYSSHVQNMLMHQPIAKLISTNLTHVSENLFGQVSQGILHLHAPIISLEYHRISKTSYTVHYYKSSDFVLQIASPSRTGRSISLDHEAPFRPAAIEEDDDSTTPTFFIPLYLDVERTTSRPKKVHGLIVEATGQKREFRRKGVMTLEGKWWVEDFAKGVKSFIGVADEDIFEGLVGEEGGWVVFDLSIV